MFDTADIIKDSIILPQAFLSALQGDTEKQFRQTCIDNFIQFEVLDKMIETLKQIAKTA